MGIHGGLSANQNQRFQYFWAHMIAAVLQQNLLVIFKMAARAYNAIHEALVEFVAGII